MILFGSMALNIMYADEFWNFIFNFNLPSEIHTAYSDLHLGLL